MKSKTVKQFKAADIARTVNNAMAEYYKYDPDSRGVVSEGVGLILSLQTKAKVAMRSRCPVCRV